MVFIGKMNFIPYWLRCLDCYTASLYQAVRSVSFVSLFVARWFLGVGAFRTSLLFQLCDAVPSNWLAVLLFSSEECIVGMVFGAACRRGTKVIWCYSTLMFLRNLMHRKWWGWGGKGTYVLYFKHVPSTSVWCEHLKAIYLFQVIPCSPCGAILFTTKPIWSKRIEQDHTQMLNKTKLTAT